MNAETAKLNGFTVETIDQVKPYKDNILYYPIPLDQERVLPSGLVIPDTQLEFHDKPRWGVVIAIGSEVKNVRRGDKVIAREGAGVSMKFQDEGEAEIREYVFIKEDHILTTFNR